MSETSTINQEEVNLHRTSNRIAAVDITRVLAALSVMYSHLYHAGLGGATGKASTDIFNVAIGTFSPVFFMLAAYFVCRNITWKKALNNAFWCFAPFLLWEAITTLVVWFVHPEQLAGKCDVISLLGINSLVTLFQQTGGPVDMPLWFMRDLVFLFLLSPILFRWCRVLLPIIIILSITPGLGYYFYHHPFVTLSPYSLSFFTLGCFLRTFDKETQQKMLRFHSPVFIIAFFVAGFGVAIAGQLGLWQYGGHWRYWNFIPAVLSIWALYQLARLIEVHSQGTTKLCLKFAPVTFLTFATHWPIYLLIAASPLRDDACMSLLLPPLIFCANCVFFLAMKRWCRPLLHLVAHYKLRPDDMPQQPAAQKQA